MLLYGHPVQLLPKYRSQCIIKYKVLSRHIIYHQMISNYLVRTLIYKPSSTMHLNSLLLVVPVLLHIATSAAVPLSPSQFAKLAADRILKNQEHFIEWFYGGAIVLDGLFLVDRTMELKHDAVLNDYLDKFKTSGGSYGHSILNGLNIPWYHNVGDNVGLFAINYLSRYVNTSQHRSSKSQSQSLAQDLIIADRTANKYILGFPVRLPNDGTFTRSYGWHGEPNGTATFLWADDMYMGLTLLARLAITLGDQSFASTAAKYSLTFAKYLLDPNDGLFYHGANAKPSPPHASCCKWGRANGWAIMAQVEVLESMQHFPELAHSPLYEKLLRVFKRHSQGVREFQSGADGRWHQVVNDSSTFLETSGTAMILSALSRGVVAQWLTYEDYQTTIYNAWRGLNRVITLDGTINGICDGLGIQADLDGYRHCATDYLNSGNGGLGSVLYAAADFQRFLQYSYQPANNMS